MTKEINEIIKENLPAQVGEILQQQLAKGEKDAKELVATVSAFESERRTNNELRARIEEYTKLDTRNAALELREKEVAEKERVIELTTLKIELAEANKRADIAVNFTNGLVRNSEFRKHIFDSENQTGYMGPNNQWIQPSNVCKSFDETKTTT